jgi:hypothetical protein
MDFVDHSPDWLGGIDLDHTSHRDARANARPSGRGHGADIMSEYNATLLHGPLQHGIVVGLGDPGVLHSDQVEIGEDSQQPADDPAVKILVGCEPQRQVEPDLA